MWFQLWSNIKVALGLFCAWIKLKYYRDHLCLPLFPYQFLLPLIRNSLTVLRHKSKYMRLMYFEPIVAERTKLLSHSVPVSIVMVLMSWRGWSGTGGGYYLSARGRASLQSAWTIWVRLAVQNLIRSHQAPYYLSNNKLRLKVKRPLF